MSSLEPYTPLHLASCYSFGYGLLTPQRICREAERRGYRSVAVVDRHNFYGMVRFLRAAERSGVKAIVGMTLMRAGRPLGTAYVLDRGGFVRLNQIVSRPQGSDALQDLLERGWEGLALMSGDRSVLQSLRKRGSRDLYVQLTYGRAFGEQLAYCRRSGLPPVAVNPALYVEPEEVRLGDLLRAISLRCTLDSLPPAMRLSPDQRLVGSREMESFFAAVPQALETARGLAERAGCDDLLPPGHVFPAYRGLSEEQCFRLLRGLCYRGALQRYGRGPAASAAPPGPGAQTSPPPHWRERLDHELRVIRRKGFAGYFLVVREILRHCSRTCGRGSSAASLVSYLLGITHVDPLRYNLDFDRFLNDRRRDPPDIDVDFPWDERDAVLSRLFRRYAGRAAMVADHVTFGPRSAMREAAGAYGLPEREIGRMVEFFKYGERGRIPPYLWEAAKCIQGLPRHVGTHCGGVVITPQPITCYTHVQSSRLGYPVMAWDRDSAAAAGLVKIDLLGNRSLAVLRDTLRLAKRRLRPPCAAAGRSRPGAPASRQGAEAGGSSAAKGSGRILSVLEIGSSPELLTLLEDEGTREMIARGQTLGLFYVESPATRQLLRKTGRGDYEHLILAGSIIRPAANATIRRYLQRLHGAPYRSPSPLLDRSLGLMVYQEDIARVAAEAAGFPPALGDRLRKVLAGNNGASRLEAYRRLFFSRGAAMKTPEAVLRELWEMMVSFRGYSFCRAHSASYALVSCKLAYLKRHFPLEFFLSVINNGGGYYPRQTYLNECRRLGIELRLPDVNRSRIAYTAEGKGIRVGLGQVRSISRAFLERVLEQRRENGCFRDSADFFRRVQPGLLEARQLVRSGALDGIAHGLTRPQLLWSYLRRYREGELFAPCPPPPGDYPEELKLVDELRTLGLMVSRHPVALFRCAAAALAEKHGLPAPIPSSLIPARVGLEVSLVGLVASGKEAVTGPRSAGAPDHPGGAGPIGSACHPGSAGAPMVFISFEDEYSLFETVLFPAVFRRQRHCIEGGGVMLVCGRVESEMGAYSVTVRWVGRPGVGRPGSAAGGRL